MESAKETVAIVRPQKRPKWMSDETFGVTHDRRKAKNAHNADEYKRLNQRFQTLVRRDKNEYLSKECTSLETHNTTGNSRELFKKI